MVIENNWSISKVIPDTLIRTKELVYNPCNFECSQPQPEKESGDYNALRFQINDKFICYRTAKITPTKTGQFVTLWKRNKLGTIEPFDFSDTIDFVIVEVQKENNLGQFIFPKAILLEKGIFSTPDKEGKRATRVYPPWDIATSKQAQKTQEWQLVYFLEITKNTTTISKARNLLDLIPFMNI